MRELWDTLIGVRLLVVLDVPNSAYTARISNPDIWSLNVVPDLRSL